MSRTLGTQRARARNFSDQLPFHRRARTVVRKTLAWIRSPLVRPPTGREWVHFPLYHHILDDERRGFGRQLRHLRRYGDFLSADDAVDALANPGGIGGRYFCVTFDDGSKDSRTNALPILVERRCPAIFFLATDYIGLDLDADWDRVRRFPQPPPPYRLPFEYLTWDDCRAMQAAGMAFGAHTCAHVRPSQLGPADFDRELRESRGRIERELGSPCHHFACPWGQPGQDFDLAVHPEHARRAGFRSFMTTEPGPNYAHADPFAIRRFPLLATHWNAQIHCRLARP
jgi:peptidoglycan/xylan/chitin deacetylase (PgdA/CDA1 family)